MKYNKIGVVTLLLACGIMTSLQATARPDVNAVKRAPGERRGQLKTTASCRPAEASIDLDINNVRARLMTGGDMWWDNGTSEARYEIPKGSRKNSLFAGSVWIGGRDEQNNLKVAAQTYRQTGNDYWPGPLDPATADITEADCSEWDRFWKLNRETINKFKLLADKSSASGDSEYEAIMQWPAKGNQDAVGRNQNPLTLHPDIDYAPFIDVDNNGIYEPENGDYPGDPARPNQDLPGDQFIWWVFNDKGNVKQQSNTEGIGIEVQASAFAFTTKDMLNDATFYNYRVINRGGLSLDSTYISTWTDADLGYYNDDYIGCDTNRGLGILYNGTSVDGTGQVNSYGDRIPMVGVDFFKGPIRTRDINGQIVVDTLGMTAFTYYNNDNSVVGNPNNGIEIYNYMSGSIRNGQRFSNDFKGPNTPSRAYGEGPLTPFVFYGDPGVRSEWSECTCGNPVGDRRFVHSAGAFKLQPGVVNDITIGAVWVSDAGGCPNTSFRKIRVADDLAQSLFDNNFQTIEGPEAPRMAVRALDRKLVFYLANDPISNNYQEKYGYDLSEAKYRVISPKAANYVKSKDSLYKFEGYRVFQLKSRYVTPADIFTENGTVDNTVAIEVFKCDIRNGITRIINYDKNTDVSDSTYIPVIKVEGDDSGIRHSFEISQDAFAEGEEKRLVNYKNYYFVAVAYAHNNFAPFNAKRADSTQDLVYLESSKGAGGSPIAVVTGTPNPANGDMGTVLNADYGDGVIIKRIEGTGNGANALSMSDSSENEALFGVPAAGGGTLHQSLQPTYKPTNGPVTVKVVDPVKLKPYDFELYLKSSDSSPTLNANNSYWFLLNTVTGDTIFSERNLAVGNEQVIEDYGFSVTIGQAPRPGDSQDLRKNGMLYNDIIFSDPSNPWLAGVNDQEDRSYLNWIRAGNKRDTFSLCNFEDIRGDSAGQYYEKLLERYSTTYATWAPWALVATDSSTACGFGVVKNGHSAVLTALPSVDIVFTKDKSKWTRSLVFEMNEERALAEGNIDKFSIRSHQSWNMDIDASGRPAYSTIQGDTGFSWFPGYAINQETGERLNIYFGEDSYLKVHNGDDMIWNPTSTILEGTGGNIAVVFGGKHYIYIENSRYDSGRAFIAAVTHPSDFIKQARFNKMAWVGVPLLNYLTDAKLTSLNDGLIPNDVRVSFKVSRPYATYNTDINNNGTLKNNGYPLYYFSTRDIAPVKLGDNANADKDALLDRIHAVPNPYYGYTGYELNRYDTRIKIINLPQRATVSVYALDGTLVRRLEKDNANQSFIDWDIRNAKGLPIASGMYLVHVNAEGIGEKVIRWFGAMRPIDITNY